MHLFCTLFAAVGILRSCWALRLDPAHKFQTRRRRGGELADRELFVFDHKTPHPVAQTYADLAHA